MRMSGAARLFMETMLEHWAAVLPVGLDNAVVEYWVPGPVVVDPERMEYPCFSAEDRYGAATTKAARNMRAAAISPAARRPLLAGAPSSGTERPAPWLILKLGAVAGLPVLSQLNFGVVQWG